MQEIIAQQQNMNDLLVAIQQLVQEDQAMVMAIQAAALACSVLAPLPPQPPGTVQFVEAPALANVDAILNTAQNKESLSLMQDAPHFLQSKI